MAASCASGERRLRPSLVILAIQNERVEIVARDLAVPLGRHHDRRGLDRAGARRRQDGGRAGPPVVASSQHRALFLPDALAEQVVDRLGDIRERGDGQRLKPFREIFELFGERTHVGDAVAPGTGPAVVDPVGRIGRVLLLRVGTALDMRPHDLRSRVGQREELRRQAQRDEADVARPLGEVDRRRAVNGQVLVTQQFYAVSLFWKPGAMSLPYVMVDDPPLAPRPGGTFAEIPHLIFHAEEPTRSGLCLFDPEGREWSPADLIAETTIYWAAEWLAYYELWHMTGEWLAPSVGYESVVRIHAAEAQSVKEVLADVH